MHSSPYVALVFCVLSICLLVCSGAASESTALVGLAAALGLAYVFVGPTKYEPVEDQLHEAMPQSKREWLGLMLVLCLGIFFRFYRLSEMPPGMFLDMGYDGWGALRILREGWHPGPALNGPNPESTLLLYALAGWFSIMPATLLWNAVFFAVISTATLVAFYGVFRSLAGPRLAFLGFIFLAVMRWHFTFGRNAFPNSFSLIFVGCCLLFFLQAMRTGRWPYFLLWGAFLGEGLWTYQSFKVIPLWMVVIGFYEIRRKPECVTLRIQKWLVALGVFLFLAFPVFWTWFGQGSMGRRESALSILSRTGESGFSHFLLSHIISYLQMLHGIGDSSPQHNIPFYPMLDVLTGIFFVVGVVVLFRRRWTRTTFYFASGMFFLSLPGLLSADSPNASRVLSMTPWVALAAGEGWLFVWDWAGETIGPLASVSWRAFLLLGLGGAAWLNGSLYFKTWASDQRVWKDHSVPETQAAETIMKTDSRIMVRIASRFKNHFTSKFLAFDRIRACDVLEPDSFLRKPPVDAMGVRYLLDPAQDLYRQALKNTFTDCRETVLRYPWGEPTIYIEDVPAEGWKSLVLDRKGYEAEYYVLDQSQNALFLERQDRFINYANGNDFPSLPSGLHGQPWGDWKGTFKSSGNEVFLINVSSMDPVDINFDGKDWRRCEGEEQYDLNFRSGKHSVEIRYILRPVWDNHLKFRILSKKDASRAVEVVMEPLK